MSACVCHMTKFKTGSIKGVEIHNQREKEGVSNTNPDIDWSRTKLNYDLHSDVQVNYSKAIKARIRSLELPKAVRKDAVVMCGLVVTSDPAFFSRLSAGQQKEFFQDSYNFLVARYGAKNVIAATVHLDETTPHMHFEMVPVTADGRLSAKALFTKTELNRLHTAFYERVGRKWGLERGVEGSKAVHVEKSRYEALNASKTLEKVKEDINSVELWKKGVQGQINAIQMDLKSMDELPEGKTAFGKVSYTPSAAAKLLQTAQAYFAEHIRNTMLKHDFDRLNEEHRALQGQVKAVQEESKILKQDLNRVNRVFQARPDIRDAFLDAEKELQQQSVRRGRQQNGASIEQDK